MSAVQHLTPTHTVQEFSSGCASMVWWTFDGTRITPPDLRDLVARVGMDPNLVPTLTLHCMSNVREFSVQRSDQDPGGCSPPEFPTRVVINILQLQRRTRQLAKVPVDNLVYDVPTKSWVARDGTGRRTFRTVSWTVSRSWTGTRSGPPGSLINQVFGSFLLRPGTFIVPHEEDPLVRVQEALQSNWSPSHYRSSTRPTIPSPVGPRQDRGGQGQE